MAEDDAKEKKKDDADAPEGEGAAEGAEGEEGEGGKKKKSKKKLILILVPVLLLVIGGVVFFLMSGGDEHAEGEEAHVEEVIEVKDFAFYDLPEILVNLASGGKSKNFLKISISLELEDPAQLPQLEKLEPRIVDKFQVYLRGLRVDDLQGTQAIYRLREELLNRVNTTAKPIQINQVLFKEILVQ